MGQKVWARLKLDWKGRADKEGTWVESLLTSDPPLVKEAWIWTRGWYHYTKERPPPPALVTIVRMTEERVYLYRRSSHPTTRMIISVVLYPFHNDG